MAELFEVCRRVCRWWEEGCVEASLFFIPMVCRVVSCFVNRTRLSRYDPVLKRKVQAARCLFVSIRPHTASLDIRWMEAWHDVWITYIRDAIDSQMAAVVQLAWYGILPSVTFGLGL